MTQPIPITLGFTNGKPAKLVESTDINLSSITANGNINAAGVSSTNISGATVSAQTLLTDSFSPANISATTISAVTLSGQTLFSQSFTPENISATNITGVNVSAGEFSSINSYIEGLSSTNLTGISVSGDNIRSPDLSSTSSLATCSVIETVSANSYLNLPAAGTTIPAGAIMMYGVSSTAPDGWLFCDGSAVSRTAYSDLFAAIASTYGDGDGSTTFNVPDFRAAFPVGANDTTLEAGKRSDTTEGAVVSSTYTLGASGGTENVVLTTAQMPSHTHTTDLEYNTGEGTGAYWKATAAGATVESPGSSSSGGDANHENRPPYTTVMYIIKT